MSQRLKEWAMTEHPEHFTDHEPAQFPPDYEEDTQDLEFWKHFNETVEALERGES